MPSIDVSQTQFQRFQKFAEPLVDTPESAFEKVLRLAEGAAVTPAANAPHQPGTYGLYDMPSLKHTDLIGGKIAGKPLSGKYWNNAVLQLLEELQGKTSLIDASKSVPVNVIESKKNDQGYTWHEKLGASVQGLAAHEAAKTILALGEQFDVPVELDVRWQNKADAAKPGGKARLVTA